MIDFDNFCTVENRNKYSSKWVQTVSHQLNYVSTLPSKTKNNTKNTADRLLQHSVEPTVPKFYRKSFNVIIIIIIIRFVKRQNVKRLPFLSIFVRTFL